VIIRAGGYSTDLRHYVNVCPGEYKTVGGNVKKNFAMVMQISVNILIRFEGGEEVLNIVRAFG
jgi:hypothetical protein